MKPLTLTSLTDLDELASPIHDLEVNLESLVTEVFTDFTRHTPLVISSKESAASAQALMKMMHVRLKFVIDDNNHFVGIVSRDDLNSQSMIRKLAEESAEREELFVTDFMRPRSSLKVFEYADVVQASIAEVIDALKFYGQQHCLVVERATHKIRGILSSSDIARKLHLDIDIHDRSSFVRIFEAVQHQHAEKVRLAS